MTNTAEDMAGQDEGLPNATRDLLAIARKAHAAQPTAETATLVAHFEAALDREHGESDKLGFRRYLQRDFHGLLVEHGITSGRICEIGGPYNSFAAEMPDYEFRYLSLYPDAQFDNVIVADATQCDYVEGGQFDAVFSVSVFEHISKPWKAAQHIARLLKPGGICYTAAPFSYFYHGAPADFWRYTPDALQLLFSELKPLKAEFYGKNRRRDNRGSAMNAVDRDGGPDFAVDAFGGWRENWFAIHAGQKDAGYLAQRLDRAERQVIINAMKTLVDLRGMDPVAAAATLRPILAGFTVNQDEELSPCKAPAGIDRSEEEIVALWDRRGRDGIKVSYSRFVMAQQLGL